MRSFSPIRKVLGHMLMGLGQLWSEQCLRSPSVQHDLLSRQGTAHGNMTFTRWQKHLLFSKGGVGCQLNKIQKNCDPLENVRTEEGGSTWGSVGDQARCGGARSTRDLVTRVNIPQRLAIHRISVA
jgi:hypothetical protein